MCTARHSGQETTPLAACFTSSYQQIKFVSLLDQLYGTGIRGTAHKWFKSYLETSRQYVDIEATNFNTGKTENIKSEDFISQGNALGYRYLVFNLR